MTDDPSTAALRERGPLPEAQVAVIIDALNRTRQALLSLAANEGTTPARNTSPLAVFRSEQLSSSVLEWGLALAEDYPHPDLTVPLVRALEQADPGRFDAYVHPVTWADAARRGLAVAAPTADECVLPLPGRGDIRILPSTSVVPDQLAMCTAGTRRVVYLPPPHLSSAAAMVYTHLRTRGLPMDEALDAAQDTITRPPARVRRASGRAI